MDLTIPSNAHRVTLLVRRSKAPKEVPAEDRTLTQAGADLCVNVSAFWEDVVGSLSSRFDVPVYLASPLPSAILTGYAIFMPPAIIRHPHLVSTASGKNIQGGAWFQALKEAGQSRIQIIRALWEDPAIWEGQPFEHQSRLVHQFIVEEGAPTFRVAISDEPAITLALLDKVKDSELGLGPCEGVLVFHDQEGEIVGAQKFVPSA